MKADRPSMAEPSARRREAVSRFSLTVGWQFVLVCILFGVCSYILNSMAVTALSLQAFDHTQLTWMFMGLSAVSFLAWLTMAFFVLRWLIGLHIDDHFVPRTDPEPPATGRPTHV